MQKKDNINLLEPVSAVEDYLDTLLQESTEQLEATKPVQLKSRLLLLPDLETSPAEPEREIEAKAEKVIEQLEETTPDVQPAEATEITHDYQYPLQCLMFTVEGNQLCIPLIDLGNVVPWGDRLTLFPDSPEWFLGLLKHRDENVKVADTANVLQINRKKVEEPSGNRHILIFGEDNWAITCDKLGDVINLNKDDIQWPKQEGTGLSLGTIRDSLAILLDPARVLAQLNRYGDNK